MRDRMRRAVGLLLTVLVSIAAIAWSGSFATTAWSAAADPPKDGFAGLPEARPGEFELYVQSLGFGEVAGSETLEEKFACKDSTKCGNQSSVTLRVVPSNYAPDVRWGDALGTGKGHVVAKIVVVDPVPFDRFNLLKDDVVYLWVGTIRGGKGAALYRNRGGQTTMVYRFANIRYCKYETYQKPAVHHFSPPKCSDPSPAMSAQSATASSRLSTLTLASLPLERSRAQGGIDGLWISCSGGCCEAQF